MNHIHLIQVRLSTSIHRSYFKDSNEIAYLQIKLTKDGENKRVAQVVTTSIETWFDSLLATYPGYDLDKVVLCRDKTCLAH